MAKIVGVMASERIVAGLVEGNQVTGPVRIYPEPGSDSEGLYGVPADEIAELIRRQIELVLHGAKVEAVGIGFAGIIRDGRIEESPNLQQAKGFHLQAALGPSFDGVLVLNDADAMAAGIAATRGKLESLVRVWTLGDGIGYGRYPQAEGVWEGGHIVVTLDPKDKFCGCGGVGHLEGIMGHAAMHRALAAGTATSIHLDGPGKFYLTGPNAGFVDVERLNIDLQDMVRMSPLQGSLFEVVPTSDEIAIVGAAVSADRARFSL
jgi:glucokinase